MMIWRCLDSLLILSAFAVVYVLPPLAVMIRLRGTADKVTLIVLSGGLGVASQALLGFLWNHLVQHTSFLEGSLYYLLWLSLWGLLRIRGTPPTCEVDQSRSETQFRGIRPGLILAAIVLAGVILRNVDALTHASLGQSDAYTHLQFLRDVFQYGQIRNIVYPPGYSWVLALPVMTFNLDAYMVARYVGPFFGALLIATLYLLGRRHSPMAGLFAAFFAAVCPLFYPLIKTGMGAFANQMGLFLFPLALFLYLTESPFLFALILLGLTVSVPLFVFTLVLIIVIHRLLCFPACSPRRWWRDNRLLLLAFLLAFALASYHFLSPGKMHVTTTASLVTGISTPASPKQSTASPSQTILASIQSNPAGKLAVDLLTVKRFGLDSVLLNLAALGLAGLFIGILVAGFRGGCTTLKLIGGWGLLTTLQAATGLLEFSLYQRSGWILLEAITLAGGVIIAKFYGIEGMMKIIRPGVMLGLFISALLAFWIPPQHRCINSGAENEIATVLRELSASRIRALHVRSPITFEPMAPSPLITRAAALPHLTVITRRYTLFNADQGNIAGVLQDPAAGIRQRPVESNSRLAPPSDNFICLIDRKIDLPDMGFLAKISPNLTQSLANYQPILYKPNEVILSFLESLPTDAWRVTREEHGQNLSIYLAERLIPLTAR
ncbi:MAG: hypothetical protein WCO42_03835 [bacterium]